MCAGRKETNTEKDLLRIFSQKEFDCVFRDAVNSSRWVIYLHGSIAPPVA